MKTLPTVDHNGIIQMAQPEQPVNRVLEMIRARQHDAEHLDNIQSTRLKQLLQQIKRTGDDQS